MRGIVGRRFGRSGGAGHPLRHVFIARRKLTRGYADAYIGLGECMHNITDGALKPPGNENPACVMQFRFGYAPITIDRDCISIDKRGTHSLGSIGEKLNRPVADLRHVCVAVAACDSQQGGDDCGEPIFDQKTKRQGAAQGHDQSQFDATLCPQETGGGGDRKCRDGNPEGRSSSLYFHGRARGNPFWRRAKVPRSHCFACHRLPKTFK
ncbi:MAG: hypothetical protein RO009_09395 [Pseudorhodoplanes sp.]|nr:hypothetical protein [Pseudorhodoplanes sp.]